MTHARSFQILSASTALMVSACAADESPSDSADAADGTVVHMLRVRNPNSARIVSDAITPRIAGLTYFGGPLLNHINVHPVFWNSATKLQSNLNAFYPAIVGGSPLWAVLAQYNIGSGTAFNGIVDTNVTRNVSDATVQSRISALITAGRLPAPTANTYYPVHFPSGMTITASDGSQSCVVFCEYHSTFVRSGVNVNYGVIPDLAQAGCNGGCGGSTVTNNTDAIATHVLAEAATDPAIGLATVFGPPLAWYDQVDNDEIADLCNGIQGSSAGFTVQKLWSNAAHACVDH
ncbi:MAG TPA: hypothetical protein VF516_34940 [Kofleriaceae bacterium]